MKVKKLYKRWWFWVIVVIVFFILFGAIGASKEDNTVQDTNKQTIEKSQDGQNTTTSTTKEVDKQVSSDPTENMTMEQKNAYNAGLNYLDAMAFSKKGLIGQLSSKEADNYPKDVAEFAVQKIEENGLVNWDKECEEAARNYLDTMPFSKEELIEQLSANEGDQFTKKQAKKAVKKVYK